MADIEEHFNTIILPKVGMVASVCGIHLDRIIQAVEDDDQRAGIIQDATRGRSRGFRTVHGSKLRDSRLAAWCQQHGPSLFNQHFAITVCMHAYNSKAYRGGND